MERARILARPRCLSGRPAPWSTTRRAGELTSDPRQVGRRSGDLLQVVEENGSAAFVTDQRDHALAREASSLRLPSRPAPQQSAGSTSEGSSTSASATKARPSRNSGASIWPSSASTVSLPDPARSRDCDDPMLPGEVDEGLQVDRSAEERRTLALGKLLGKPTNRLSLALQAPVGSGTTRPSPATA